MTRRSLLQTLPAPLLAAAARIQVESDGMLSVDGTRQFILGLYNLPKSAAPWREAREAGFNLVRVEPAQLRTARENGMYGWVGIGSISPAKRRQDEERIRKIVQACKDEEALLLWETEDEPAFVWKKKDARVPAENIIAARRFVQSLGAAQPFYLNHAPTNLVSTLRAYNAGADVIATDIYPVIPPGIREMYALWPDGQQGDLLNPYISQVGQYADKMRQVAGPSKAVFMVLQAFAWEKLREKQQDPAKVLYPTRAQTRFMAYQSIVHGVNGLIYWGLAYTPPEAPVWSDLKTLGAELRELRSELAAPPAPLNLELEYHETGHTVDRGIEWTVRPSRNGVVLIAVNADRNPVEVAFRGLRSFATCRVLFETRQARLTGDSIRESFAPFDVQVYRLTAR